MTEFKGVVAALSQTLNKRGFSELTPVQEAVLAPQLEDADLLVSAQTGSGKTVAFGMALAPTLLEGEDRFSWGEGGGGSAPLALVVAPTRELALQVKRELEWLYEAAGARVASCVGGMDMRDERRALGRGAHIVVGTPGRLVDHIKRRSLDMRALRAVVLDEADEMLDLGFREDLEFILGEAPDERRTLMFSATVPRSIATLAKNYQRNAVRVNTAAEQKQHLDIEYRAMTVASHDRENAIINVLRYFDAKNALVFCATRATVNHMTSRFNNRGFSVVALSGELSQKERTHALQALRDGRAKVCVATDVAARGIDLPDLELVIHADLPRSGDTLLHRSGRTGRAGRKGVSALIVPHNASRQAQRLLANAKIKASWVEPPSAADVRARDDERLMADPALSELIKDNERDLIKALLERHGPEQLAAAFLRQHRAGKSAPEELRDVPAEKAAGEPRKTKSRDNFENSVWVSLSVGRKTSAEPRWLLPILCKAGGLSKRDIGAIRVNEQNTHVELASACVERFFETVGPGGKLEKSIIVSRMGNAPDASRKTPRSAGDKPYEKNKRKKSYIAKKSVQEETRQNPVEVRDEASGFVKPGSPGKPSGKPGGKSFGKPFGKPGDKPAGKKPRKAKHSKDKGKRRQPSTSSGLPAGKPGAHQPIPPMKKTNTE